MLLLASLLTALLFLLLPDPAWAWGPGVHLAIGNQLLRTPHILGPELTALLAAHPQAFLYGALSADIFVGKGCRARPGHSHNWETALSLLQSADAPEQRAYALGYATHLAADVLAHNYYVPTLLGLTPGKGKFSHVLVEMHADKRVRWSGRQAAGLFRLPNVADQDAFLLQATHNKRWSFLLKKQLYRGSVQFSGSRELDTALRRLGDMLSMTPSQSSQEADRRVAAVVWRNHAYLQLMLDLSLVLAREAVLQPEVCLARDFDPVGTQNLAAVRQLRRQRERRVIVGPGELFPLAPPLERFALDLQELNAPEDSAPADLSELSSLQQVKPVGDMEKRIITPGE